MKNITLTNRITQISKSSLIVISIPILTYLGAQIKIYLPFTPVPVTFQTFFVLISSSLTEWYLSTAGQILYLLTAIFGIPVTANNITGLKVLLSPTSGYLIGFIVSSFFVSKFVKKYKNSLQKLLIAFVIGNIIIYIFGVLRLSFIYGIKNSIKIGILPFVYGDIIKIFLAILTSKFLLSKIK